MTYLTKDDRKALADITFGFDYQRRVYEAVEDIVKRHVVAALRAAGNDWGHSDESSAWINPDLWLHDRADSIEQGGRE